MARRPLPPKRKHKKLPRKPSKPRTDPLAQMLAKTVREGHGEDQAATFDQSEQLGGPRGYIGTRNIALDRAIGSRVPQGRVIEFFGLNASGKTTAADQLGAQCQAEGGIYIVADPERKRDRAYMAQLGVQNAATVWIGARVIEMIFEELETIARTTASANMLAWKQALDLAGFKTPSLGRYLYKTFDIYAVKAKRRPVASFNLYEWTMDHAVALKKYQIANGLQPSSIRDEPTREHLRPVVVYDANDQPYDGDIRNKQYVESFEAGQVGEWGPLAAHKADRPVVFCWDSVGGTPTKREVMDIASDQHVGLAAQVIKLNLRRLIQVLDDAAITFCAVNQQYHVIEQNTGGFGGPPQKKKMKTYGGEAIPYHACIRVELKRVGSILMPGKADDDDRQQIGQITQATIVKNTVGVPWKKVQYGIIYGRGAENAWSMYHDLKARGIIAVSGGWSKFTDSSLGGGSWHGWSGLANRMATDQRLYDKLAAIYMEG